MLIIGLTGSIGMGKSATADLFRQHGIPVFDADREVHRLYAGTAAHSIEAAFPGTVADGVVDRQALSSHVVGKPDAMAKLERIVHPLVRESEETFIKKAISDGHRQCVLEVPLLLENDAAARCDLVVVASCPPDIQRQRVLARPGMTVEKFDAILAKQMPDAEKRQRAHALVPTGDGFPAAEKAVADIMRAVAAIPGHCCANRLIAR